LQRQHLDLLVKGGAIRGPVEKLTVGDVLESGATPAVACACLIRHQFLEIIQKKGSDRSFYPNIIITLGGEQGGWHSEPSPDKRQIVQMEISERVVKLESPQRAFMMPQILDRPPSKGPIDPMKHAPGFFDDVDFNLYLEEVRDFLTLPIAEYKKAWRREMPEKKRVFGNTSVVRALKWNEWPHIVVFRVIEEPSERLLWAVDEAIRRLEAVLNTISSMRNYRL
jgi:hypothetical protein